jgi:beta-barrel assembly-enhancing protease
VTRGHLYDGHSGVRHTVSAASAPSGLRLWSDGWEDLVPLGTLTLADRHQGSLTLIRTDAPGWRLKLLAPVAPELNALFPKRHGYGRWIDRIGVWPATAAFGTVAAAVVAFGYFAPTLLAPFVPASVERAYGSALVGDFGGKYCSSPAGDAALKRLTAKLEPQAEDMNIRVVAVPMVNAAALPAGNIMIFEGLLKQVSGPDELAGILAHEIAHVRRRHVTAAMIREFGIGIFTTTLGGGTASNIDGFVSLSFTRRGEREADRDAIDRLQRANISPRATAAFFQRLSKLEVKLGRFEPAMTYMSSHPLSADREKLFANAARKGAPYAPALTPAEWRALRTICKPARSR